ncbi:DUF2637 domain-containing protein [Kitasatospora indigofera]|uniref:DUF2637 domain-containing protein n=1 Tax=Kitasatospora indigofera TaxID=67307 RepID=UPI003696BB5F
MDSDHQEPRTPNVPLKLSRLEKALGVVAVLAASTAGGFGFAQSFEAVSAWGKQAGFLRSWMLPLTVDLLIPAFGILSCLLIRLGMEYKLLRWAPLGMTLATVYLNTNTGQILSYKIAHGLTAGVFALVTEVGMHYYRFKSGIESGTRMGRVRPVRWLLSPWPTFKIWRRMVLWEIRDYEVAIQLELQRQLAVADLEEEYGKHWKKHAPRRTVASLRLGMTPNQAKAATDAEQEQVPGNRVLSIAAPPADSAGTQKQLEELTKMVRTLAAAGPAVPLQAVTPPQATAVEAPSSTLAHPGDHLNGNQVPAGVAEVTTMPVTPAEEVPDSEAITSVPPVPQAAEVPAPVPGTWPETVTTQVPPELDEGARRWLAQSLNAARGTTQHVSLPAQMTPPRPTATDPATGGESGHQPQISGPDETHRLTEADPGEGTERENVELQDGEVAIDADERLRRIREVKGVMSQRKAGRYAQCTATYVRKVWAAMDDAEKKAEEGQQAEGAEKDDAKDLIDA